MSRDQALFSLLDSGVLTTHYFIYLDETRLEIKDRILKNTDVQSLPINVMNI